MLICSTIFLENEAIVISGTQKAVKVAKKVFRKVKMDTCMPEEDLELSQDNVAIGEWHQSSGVVPKTLSKIKFASREVAKIDLVKVDGQRRALHEEEGTRHHGGSAD